MIKVGDLVRARHWYRGEMGIVMKTHTWGIVRVKIITAHGIMEIDQLVDDLEVLKCD